MYQFFLFLIPILIFHFLVRDVLTIKQTGNNLVTSFRPSIVMSVVPTNAVKEGDSVTLVCLISKVDTEMQFIKYSHNLYCPLMFSSPGISQQIPCFEDCKHMCADCGVSLGLQLKKVNCSKQIFSDTSTDNEHFTTQVLYVIKNVTPNFSGNYWCEFYDQASNVITLNVQERQQSTLLIYPVSTPGKTNSGGGGNGMELEELKIKLEQTNDELSMKHRLTIIFAVFFFTILIVFSVCVIRCILIKHYGDKTNGKVKMKAFLCLDPEVKFRRRDRGDGADSSSMLRIGSHSLASGISIQAEAAESPGTDSSVISININVPRKKLNGAASLPRLTSASSTLGSQNPMGSFYNSPAPKLLSRSSNRLCTSRNSVQCLTARDNYLYSIDIPPFSKNHVEVSNAVPQRNNNATNVSLLTSQGEIMEMETVIE